MTHSLLNELMADDVLALLDKVDGPPEAARAMSREKAAEIIHAVLWAHGTRGGSFASCYAFDAWETALKQSPTEENSHEPT